MTLQPTIRLRRIPAFHIFGFVDFMDIDSLNRAAKELSHIVMGSPEASDVLKEDVRLLVADCEASATPSPEELEVLNKSYEGLVKRAQRCGALAG